MTSANEMLKEGLSLKGRRSVKPDPDNTYSAVLNPFTVLGLCF